MQPVVEARGLIIQPFCDCRKTISGWNQTCTCRTEAIAILVWLSTYDNNPCLRLDWVQIGQRNDQAPPPAQEATKPFRQYCRFEKVDLHRYNLVGTQQVKLVQPVVEARGLIIQTVCDGRKTMSGYGIKHAELKQLRFWFCFLHITTIFG